MNTKLFMQMKKDHIVTVAIKILFCLIFLTNTVIADDFVMPDWSYYSYREKAKIIENAATIKYEKIRTEQDFHNFFDKQTITIYKNTKNILPTFAGKTFLINAKKNTEKFEQYIIKDDSNDFIASYCSQEKMKCEIIRFYQGFDGLVEVKYTHNNLWHFQNNIGSFISAQMMIQHLPYEFMFNKLVNDKRMIRL